VPAITVTIATAKVIVIANGSRCSMPYERQRQAASQCDEWPALECIEANNGDQPEYRGGDEGDIEPGGHSTIPQRRGT
jgi:hypothetical protein